ncbi:AraC family transcriptional regulator [Parasphaerochaeta coccoides]|nr:AraC family transcriptional regulator [Parasphaerochaeta coccoides]
MTLFAVDYLTDPALPFRIIKRNPEIPYSLHTHDFYELVVTVSGQGTHFWQGGEQKLSSGMVFVMHPGQAHGFRDVDNLILYNFISLPDALTEKFPDLSTMPSFQALFGLSRLYQQKPIPIPSFTLKPSELTEICGIAEKLLREMGFSGYGEGAKTLSLAYAGEMLVKLFRFHEQKLITENILIDDLAHVFSFMEAHADRQVSTDELVTVAHMSTSTLNRYFHRCTGMSPVQYHLKKRISKACYLIRSSNMSIGEISEKTGFSDANYFCRQFKKVMGISPLQHRRNP